MTLLVVQYTIVEMSLWFFCEGNLIVLQMHVLVSLCISVSEFEVPSTATLQTEANVNR